MQRRHIGLPDTPYEYYVSSTETDACIVGSVLVQTSATKSERAGYWICAIALALLMFMLAFACVVPNKSGYTLPEYVSQVVENHQVKAYIDNHKGEQSAAERAAEKGLAFDYGLVIATNSDSPDVDPTLVAYTNQQLSNVPDYIKTMFVDDGWVIKLSSEDLGTRFQDSGFSPKKLWGLTSYSEKIIYIDANSYSVEAAAIHEIGHYLDCKLGVVSTSDEFQQALASDKAVFAFYFSQRSEMSDTEMFAETFSMFCKHKEQMKQYCPSIYEFFIDTI